MARIAVTLPILSARTDEPVHVTARSCSIRRETFRRRDVLFARPLPHESRPRPRDESSLLSHRGALRVAVRRLDRDASLHDAADPPRLQRHRESRHARDRGDGAVAARVLAMARAADAFSCALLRTGVWIFDRVEVFMHRVRARRLRGDWRAVLRRDSDRARRRGVRAVAHVPAGAASVDGVQGRNREHPAHVAQSIRFVRVRPVEQRWVVVVFPRMGKSSHSSSGSRTRVRSRSTTMTAEAASASRWRSRTCWHIAACSQTDSSMIRMTPA